MGANIVQFNDDISSLKYSFDMAQVARALTGVGLSPDAFNNLVDVKVTFNPVFQP